MCEAIHNFRSISKMIHPFHFKTTWRKRIHGIDKAMLELFNTPNSSEYSKHQYHLKNNNWTKRTPKCFFVVVISLVVPLDLWWYHNIQISPVISIKLERTKFDISSVKKSAQCFFSKVIFVLYLLPNCCYWF